MNRTSTEHQHLPEAIALLPASAPARPGQRERVRCSYRAPRHSLPERLFDPCDALSQIKAGA